MCGGQIVNELNNAQQLGKRANSRKNSKLSTLEYLEAAKVEINGDILYLAGNVDGKLGRGSLYVKAEALAALAAAQGKYSSDFGNFVIIAEGKVYGAGVGGAVDVGVNKEKGTIKLKGDLSYGVVQVVA